MRGPIARGVTMAVAAAVAFGATTPIVAWAGHVVGPLTTAALLYAGAALVAQLPRTREPGARLRRGDAPRLVAVTVAGGAIAPALLAWGLQRSGALAGALLLNLEAVFTVALAAAIYREHLGRRVAVAAAAMVAGGALLVFDLVDVSATSDAFGAWGAAAVACATLFWAIDNTLTRPLAERDPMSVVGAKGALGALLTATAAVIAGESLPPLRESLALLACGATGYGASLRLYLGAQRAIGAARTGSVFAVAPFVGAALAIALGDRAAGASTVIAAACFALGVYLHVTERHAHRHHHPALEHDHAHRHDDGHHTHAHDPPIAGEHAHPHHHDELDHEHEHAADVHHEHAH
jgi:drug/metabolite transporter (DMT)-like permease|nr:DMT family transporter [Kofleriaceae bacterium]